MIVKILNEAGYEEALMGLSLSYMSDPNSKVLEKLAFKQGGHNKALESIVVWLDVTAPLYWWKQADTYRLSTKQSSSIMHSIKKQLPLKQSDFELNLNSDFLQDLNYQLANTSDIDEIQNIIPGGFLQRRIWMVSYKTLQNIIIQRRSHKLKCWKEFCGSVLAQASHPELLCETKRVLMHTDGVRELTLDIKTTL